MGELLVVGPGGGGGGSGNGGYSFVFDPTAIQNPAINLFSSWPALITAINAIPRGAPPVITFEGDFTVPLAGMPVTGWPMNLATLRSVVPATGAVTLTIPDGAKLDMVGKISDGLIVTAAPTTDGVFEFSQFPPGTVPRVLEVAGGAALQNLSPNSSALILTPGVLAQTYTVLAFFGASQSAIPPSTGPFVREQGNDVVVGVVMTPGVFGQFPPGWIVGTGTLIYQFGVEGIAPATPGFVGTITPIPVGQAVLAPLAQTTTRKQLIFTNLPLAPNRPDVFNDWAKLMATYSITTGPIDIAFVQDQTTPGLDIPAGLWAMRQGTRWVSGTALADACLVRLSDGCVIQDLQQVCDNLAVAGNSTTPCLTFSPAVGGSPRVLLVSGPGARMGNFGTSVMIAWDKDSATDLLILGLLSGGNITNGAGPTPIVDVTPAGAFQSIVVFYGLGGTLDRAVLSGADANGGTARAGFVATDVAQVSLDQPGWAAAASLDAGFQSLGRPRYNIQTPPLTAVGPYIMGNDSSGIFNDTNEENGSEFVRTSATANAVGIQLPDPRFCPCQTVLVKDVSGAPAFPVNITTPSGLIDGAALFNPPMTPYSAVRFVSDGTNWWVTG